MPMHELHHTLENLYIGYGMEQPDVHARLDQFAKVLQSNHRLFFHDFRAVMYFYEVEQDIYRCWSAWAHLILDNISMMEGVGKSRCVAKFLQLVQDGVLPEFTTEQLPPKVLPYFDDDGYDWNEDYSDFVVRL